MLNHRNFRTYHTAQKSKSYARVHRQSSSKSATCNGEENVEADLDSVLARPVMIISEPIVACTDLFLALEYTIFFLYFEVYPFIFKG